MKDYIPTIEELQAKPSSELQAMFRTAAEIADDASRPVIERNAAKRTAAVVRRCLNRPPAP